MTLLLPAPPPCCPNAPPGAGTGPAAAAADDEQPGSSPDTPMLFDMDFMEFMLPGAMDMLLMFMAFMETWKLPAGVKQLAAEPGVKGIAPAPPSGMWLPLGEQSRLGHQEGGRDPCIGPEAPAAATAWQPCAMCMFMLMLPMLRFAGMPCIPLLLLG